MKTAAALVMGFAMLTGCGDTGPILIGFIAGISGDGADTGQSSLNALTMAVDDINDHGGINGRRVEIVARDDNKDPATAQQAMREFKELGVTAVIGPIISSIASAMLPVINELDLVTISPTVSATEFTGFQDNLFRINSTTRDNASAYAQHSIDKGRKRVAIALDGENEAFTESWYREFLLAFDKLDGRVVAKIWFNGNQESSFGQTAQTLLGEQPDAIILVANGHDSAELARAIRARGSNIPLVAAEWAGTEQLLSMGGTAVEGMELIQSYDRYATNPRYRQFVATYSERFKEQPGYAAVLTHDAATVLFAALKSRHPDQPLTDALVNLPPQDGLNQPLKFDQFGDGNRTSYYVHIRNGQFVLE